MRKSDKKIDNQLRILLTEICETALESIDGFQWITHVVNYSLFPQSLRIVCVFDSNESLEKYLQSDNSQQLSSSITKALSQMGLKFKNIDKHMLLDTEENCDEQQDGNWARRLNKFDS